MRSTFFVLSGLVISGLAGAQETYPYNGVRPKEVTADAFTNAVVWIDADTRIDGATLLIEKGRVVAAGSDVEIPPNAVVHDMTGRHIYPSFIELSSDYGIPESDSPVKSSDRGGKPQMDTERKGAFGWNQAIRADFDASEAFVPDEKLAESLRSMGFGAVLTHKSDGIARGTSALVALGDKASQSLLRARAGSHYSFRKGTSSQTYPSSPMGCIALLRQTYLDARWYAAGGNQLERNLTLEAWTDQQTLPAFFETSHKWEVLRADRIGDEFGVQYIFRGSGDEYQRLEDIKATGGAVIVPLQFPSAWNVSDPNAARLVSTAEMKHWELAPSNPARLRNAGITVAFTADGLKDTKEFFAALRRVKRAGMTESDILRALTLTPASLIHGENEIGALRPGMRANFFITSDNLLAEDMVIYDHYVMGRLYQVNAVQPASLAGEYALQTPFAGNAILRVNGKPGGYKASMTVPVSILAEQDLVHGETTFRQDSIVRSVRIEQSESEINMIVEPDSAGKYALWILNGSVLGTEIKGHGQDSQGKRFDWSASLIARGVEAKESQRATYEAAPYGGELYYPFTAYGWRERPKQETVHFVHATVWTCEKDGRIEDGEVLIHDGRIVAVGKNLNTKAYPNVKVIDATGKHITPGIIDEHSHIALDGVNEGGQASSAEVMQSSVIDPEDINIYRQLSGGVTAAQLLHGSANPIGGQSAIIKLRWGSNDEEMLIEGADGFIKFALGENVKQSNWGDQVRERFPQTRMGVEQVYYDHFIRAREYGEAIRKASTAGKSSVSGNAVPPRRDLELETLLEILDGKRFVTCHSYQQGEINMLMHVADSMGFRLNTFTHILEGYKVADKMKAHGAGGSTFSDWWAYKMEVKDAIPYNGAIMWKNGITVAYNSDDPEMARRLNQEAAKAVKYGGVPEEEALKFVTLNPAKLLHLDHRMGSLKAGKDADLVVWSDHPLSVYASVEQTYVDGIAYFDARQDALEREALQKERARLMALMLSEMRKGGPVKEPELKQQRYFHCDSLNNQ